MAVFNHIGQKWFLPKNIFSVGFPSISGVMNPPVHLPMQEMRVRSLGWKDPLEKEVATHSSVLAWRNPWIEEAGGARVHWSDTIEHVHATTRNGDWTRGAGEKNSMF